MFLKITPTTGIGRAIKVGKLSPCFIGPFQILKQIGSIAYQVALPPHLSNLHNVFHISQLRQYHLDPSHFLAPESIQLKDDLTFHIPPARIVDKSIKQLQNKTVPLVKIPWGRTGAEDYMWELESYMRREYTELFSDNKF